MIPPEEIADMIVYLASRRASTISGQAISVDGDTQSLV
ncbi:MAG: SDR family oxidoreductase [Pseudomonadota bacterium]